MKQLLWRVPVFIWLFIATSQVLAIIHSLHKLPQLEETDALARSLYSASTIRRFDSIRWKLQLDLVVGVILGPVSVGMAYWKWSAGRSLPVVGVESK